MANTLTSIRLSETQKTLMCQIIAAPTEELAYEASEDGTNIMAARDQLEKLGLIDWEEGSASVTDNGMEVLKDEALVDDMGELTEEGSKYAYGEEGNPQQQQTADDESDPLGMGDMGMEGGEAGSQQPDPGNMPDAGSVDQAAQTGAEPQLNSFNLLKSMNDAHSLIEDIAAFKKS